MESSSSSPMKLSPLDLMAAIIKGKVDPSNVSSGSVGAEVASLILVNREVLMMLTTSFIVLMGCFVVLLGKRSNG